SEITRTLGSSPDRRTLHEQILNLLHRELRLPCVLLASHPGQDGVVAICQKGVDPGAANGLMLGAGDPELDSMRDEEGAMVVDPGQAETRLAGWCAQHGYRRGAAAPMHCRGRFKGILLVLSRRQDRPAPGELGLLTALAAQAALILDN